MIHIGLVAGDHGGQVMTGERVLVVAASRHVLPVFGQFTTVRNQRVEGIDVVKTLTAISLFLTMLRIGRVFLLLTPCCRNGAGKTGANGCPGKQSLPS